VEAPRDCAGARAQTGTQATPRALYPCEFGRQLLDCGGPPPLSEDVRARLSTPPPQPPRASREMLHNFRGFRGNGQLGPEAITPRAIY